MVRKLCAVTALALSSLSCTQWGTYALRSGEIWWACQDRNAKCSTEDAEVTLIQMRNTFRAEKIELCKMESTGGLSDQQRDKLREAVAKAQTAEVLVKASPVYWGKNLQDFVQATVTAEKMIERRRGVFGYGLQTNHFDGGCAQ